MEIRYHAQFNRDLRRLRNPSLARHYRIRIGEYRLGITQDGDAIILRRLLHRSEIYRNFP